MRRRLAVAVLAALAAAPAANAQRPDGSVPFYPVAKGQRTATMADAPATRVIRTQKRWREAWRTLGGPARRPRIDFSRYMLIAVTQGRQRSGGYGIEIAKIERTTSGRHVTVLETRPGAGCPVTLAITAPYHVVRVRRSAARPTVERQRTRGDCR
jgi:hypothetical protein